MGLTSYGSAWKDLLLPSYVEIQLSSEAISVQTFLPIELGKVIAIDWRPSSVRLQSFQPPFFCSSSYIETLSLIDAFPIDPFSILSFLTVRSKCLTGDGPANWVALTLGAETGGKRHTVYYTRKSKLYLGKSPIYTEGVEEKKNKKTLFLFKKRQKEKEKSQTSHTDDSYIYIYYSYSGGIYCSVQKGERQTWSERATHVKME